MLNKIKVFMLCFLSVMHAPEQLCWPCRSFGRAQKIERNAQQNAEVLVLQDGTLNLPEIIKALEMPQPALKVPQVALGVTEFLDLPDFSKLRTLSSKFNRTIGPIFDAKAFEYFMLAREKGEVHRLVLEEYMHWPISPYDVRGRAESLIQQTFHLSSLVPQFVSLLQELRSSEGCIYDAESKLLNLPRATILISISEINAKIEQEQIEMNEFKSFMQFNPGERNSWRYRMYGKSPEIQNLFEPWRICIEYYEYLKRFILLESFVRHQLYVRRPSLLRSIFHELVSRV